MGKGFFVLLFVPNKKYGNNRRKAEKAHEVCRPGRGKLSAKRKVSKGFNFVRAKPPLRRAESRFAEPRCSLQRERVYSFRLYEKNGEYPRGLRTSGLRGRFKALSKKISAKFSDGTSRNRFFVQNGGEKALNRCDVPALQRKDLERRSKEQPYSFANSRLWLGANGKRRVEESCFGWQ